MKITRSDLLVKSLELDPRSSHASRDLAATLGPEERVTLADGTACDARELLLRALRLDPKDALSLTLLAGCLNEGEAVQLSTSSAPQTARDLLFEALRLDDTLAQAYHALASTWAEPPGTRLLLPDGRRWGRRELFLRAAELDPSSASSLRGLAGTLAGPPDFVQLAGGAVMTRRDLLVKAGALERWERKAHDPLTEERWQPVTGLHGERWRAPTRELLPPTPRPLPVRCFHPPRHVPAP
mmetsp:Transcript_87342/g.271334  ORF Transcript_87342/g.271334 Transcript_87342/m.271334 type:complete len:240 (+) Transcript_87342:1-720(+)